SVLAGAAHEEELALGTAHDAVHEAGHRERADRLPRAAVVIEADDAAVDRARDEHAVVPVRAGAERRPGKVGALRPRALLRIEDVDAPARLALFVEASDRVDPAPARGDRE